MEVVFDAQVELGADARGIDVLVAEEELAVVFAREFACDTGGQCVAEVEPAGGAGCEARADAHALSMAGEGGAARASMGAMGHETPACSVSHS